MRISILCASALFGATAAHAATSTDVGHNLVTDHGGDVYTHVFDDDTAGDRIEQGIGLTFTGGGTDFTATSDQGDVYQDRKPSHGGLGLFSGVTGDTDNLETDLGETLKVTFAGAVDIIGFTFNGLIGSDGHTDAASGAFSITSGMVPVGGDASAHDGIADVYGFGGSSFCDDNGSFCGTTMILFSGSQFRGYLESITYRTVAPGGPGTPVIPLPASLGLLLAGMAGLGFAGGKRRAS